MFVKEIDGSPIPFPTKESEVFALASRLGDEGVAAILDCVNENVDISDSRNSEEEDKLTLKK